MKKDLSPHAKILIELIDNVRSLARHHKYTEARDVVKAIGLIAKDFGFEISSDMIDDVIEVLGHTTQIATQSMLDGFTYFIVGFDNKIDNETLTGIDYGKPNITRLSPYPNPSVGTAE